MDIYLHDVLEEDMAMLDQEVMRHALLEKGVKLTPHRVGVARNELIRCLIHKEAGIERTTTAGYAIKSESDLAGLPMTHWLIPNGKGTSLVVPKPDAKECELWLRKMRIRFERIY